MTGRDRAFADLHTHSRGSFDSLADPASMMKAAVSRGLTHLAITDHDRIDVALDAREHAPDGLTLIVGEEIKTLEGDLIGLFLERSCRPVCPPPKRSRRSASRAASSASRIRSIRIGARCCVTRRWPRSCPSSTGSRRTTPGSSARATNRPPSSRMANELPGISVSDAHSVMEVGVAYTALGGDPSTPAGLLAALHSIEIIPGRASYIIRAWTPVAKLVNERRGNGRVTAAAVAP